MTRKQIDASREARLWIRDIFIPAAGIVGLAMTNPKVREATANAGKKVVAKVKGLFKKKEVKEKSPQ